MVFKFLKLDRNRTCNVDSASRSAEEIILQWGSTVRGEANEQMIFNGDRFRIDQYLQAVDEIQRWTECATTSDDQTKAKRVSQIAMARLEHEFRIILNGTSSTASNSRTNTKASTSLSSVTDSTTSYGDYDYYSEYSTMKIHDLRSIAEKMNSAGHLCECTKLYKGVRKSFLDASFRRLGFQKLSVAEVPRLEWSVLEAEIRQWIHAAKFCVLILFASEERLCEQIFEGLGSDTCFVEIVKDHAIQLFSFVEAVSISTRPSPERLFKILDLYKTSFDLLVNGDVVSQSKSLKLVFLQAPGMVNQLAEAARGILLKFENDVLHESSNFLDHKGGIHPLTRYVVNYIILMSSYKETLTDLIVSMPSKENNRSYSNDLTIPDLKFSEFEERTPLVVHLIWIIHLLQFKLKSKSKCYDDASLAQFFLINNFYYITKTIYESPFLQNMIGDHYKEKLSENVRQVVIAYQTSTWDGVFHCLRDEGVDVSTNFSSMVSKKSLGERLKSFNAMFEEVHQRQATWLVEDLQLRKELQLFILEELIPAYKSFLRWIEEGLIGSGRHGEISIKFSVEDLETAISNFFVGRPQSNPIVNFEGHPIPHRSNPRVRCWQCLFQI